MNNDEMKIIRPVVEPLLVSITNLDVTMEEMLRESGQLILSINQTIYTFFGFDEVNEEPIYGHTYDTDMQAISRKCYEKPEAREHSEIKEFSTPWDESYFQIWGVFRGHVSCVEQDGLTYYDLR